MEDGINTVSARGSMFERVAGYVVGGVALLLPLFFIPDAVFPFQFSKVAVALVGVVVVLGIFSLQVLRKGSVSFLWSKLILGLLVLPLAYLVSSIFSPVPVVSLFGYQLDQDTFGFIALAAMLALATTLVIKSEKRIFSTLMAVMVSGWAVLVFQAIQLFFKAPLLPSLFTSPVANTVGSWNDLALFIGLIAVLALFALETFTLDRVAKMLLSATLVVALSFLAVANFQLSWILVSSVAFVMLLSAFTRRRPGGESVGAPMPALGKQGIISCLVLVVGVFFVFFGGTLATGLQNNFGIQALDVRPSVQGTLSVLEHSYGTNAVFGSGPNTFDSEWLTARPAQILATPFWNVAFKSGSGSIPTSFVTGGVIVALAWLLLIGLFLYSAVRALLTAPMKADRSYLLIAATALGSFFLMVAHIFYVPSQGLTLLFFLFLGLFVASLRGTTLARPVSISFSESPRLGFLSVLVVAVSLVVSLVSVYGAGEVYASAVYEGIAVLRSNAGKLDEAVTAVTHAAELSPQDRYYRMLTALELAQLNALVQKGGSDKKTQDEFQAGLARAVTASQNAIAANPMNFDNWMSRASVYEAVVPLNIAGASEKALETLEEARKRNPNTPEVDYHVASLKAFARDNAGVRASAEASLARKADYTPSILLLAQLALSEGRLDDAIVSVNSAIVFNPGNSSLLYQLGLLQLQAKKYQDAVDSFDAALAITPDFANASFFLGQANVSLGKKDEALVLFKALQVKNPDNATLTDVIAALEKGEDPFAGGTVAPSETPAGS